MKSGWRGALPYYPLLPAGAVAAIVWAAAASDSYFRFAQALAFPVNDIGVALGLAWLAQEVLEAAGPGRGLPGWRWTAGAGAMGIGGAAAAAATYVWYVHLSGEPVLLRGWPIVCGVDVFLGVAVARAIFTHGAPVKVVMIVALVADVLALVLVSHRPFESAAAGAAYGLIVLAVAVAGLFRIARIRTMWAYLLGPGTLAWFGCYWAGLHPALSLLPVVPFFPRSPRRFGDFSAERHHHASPAHFESAFAYPLQLVAFLFGLVNAGVLWREFGAGTWAVLAANLAGRPIGILLTAALWTTMSGSRLRWADLVVVALIASAGSVFALFLSIAVFPAGPLLAEAKLGAMATVSGALLAGLAARTLGVGRFVQGRHP